MLDLPNQVAEYVQKIISNIFDLIWNSGIQTVLFIAGLQSIPSSLYEASRVGGRYKVGGILVYNLPDAFKCNAARYGIYNG